VLLVHEIYYVPVGDGWEEVLVRNIFHYVPATPSPPPTALLHDIQQGRIKYII
jgi:hypothetical protein